MLRFKAQSHVIAGNSGKAMVHNAAVPCRITIHRMKDVVRELTKLREKIPGVIPENTTHVKKCAVTE